MKKRVMIYDTSIYGHHMEYLHHIYMATEGREADFVFVIPDEFKQLEGKLEWPNRRNVAFDLIPKSVIDNLNGGWFSSRWKRANLCANYIRKHEVQEVFFIELIVQFPFLPLFVPKGVRLSGILYQLIPYEWNRLSRVSKIKCAIEVASYAKSRCVKAPMTLNDNSCACYYNRRFHTDKFISIVDPVMPLAYKPQDVRRELRLSDDDKMILHFGGMTNRKGTLLILEAANLMSVEQLKDKVFVFAGKVGQDIRVSFYKMIDQLKDKTRIYVFDEFCTYERLADLCHSCDCILVPYRNYSYSSGVIGYSAQFQKTVIGPNLGILGKLIRRNKLGPLLSNLDAVSLAKVLLQEDSYIGRENNYVEKETVESFCKTIMETVLKL